MAEQLHEIEQMADKNGTADKYLTFWTADQLFGVSIADVVQIVQMQPVTEVPEYPDYARGIMTLRGSVIPVVDVRRRFHMPDKPDDDRTCIVVCSLGGKFLGFLVEQVEEVTEIRPDDIAAPPELANEQMADYLMGVCQRGDRLILLMDMNKFLSAGQLEQLVQTGS